MLDTFQKETMDSKRNANLSGASSGGASVYLYLMMLAILIFIRFFHTDTILTVSIQQIMFYGSQYILQNRIYDSKKRRSWFNIC